MVGPVKMELSLGAILTSALLVIQTLILLVTWAGQIPEMRANLNALGDRMTTLEHAYDKLDERLLDSEKTNSRVLERLNMQASPGRR